MPLDSSVDKVRVRGRAQFSTGLASPPPSFFSTVERILNKVSHSRIAMQPVQPYDNQTTTPGATDPAMWNPTTGDWWADLIAVDDADLLASGQTQWGQWGCDDRGQRYFIEPKLVSPTFYGNPTTGAPLAQGSGGIRTVWLDDLVQLYGPTSIPGAAVPSIEDIQDAVSPMFTTGPHNGIGFAYDDDGNRVIATVTVTGDLPESSAGVLSTATGTPTDLLGKVNEYTGTVTQTMPAATPGRVLAFRQRTVGLTLQRAGSDVFVLGDGTQVTTVSPSIAGELVQYHCTVAGQWRAVSDFKPASALLRVTEAAPTPQRHGALGNGVADDTTALKAFLAAGYSDGYIPPGSYPTGESLVQPASMSVTLSRAARIKATASMASLWGTNIGQNPQNKALVGGIFDCNNLAQIGINLPYFHVFALKSNRVERSAGHSVVVGDPNTSDPAAQLYVEDLNIWRADGETAPTGSYGLWLRRAYDSHVLNGIIVGAKAAAVRADMGANYFTDVHAWGYSGQVPDVCFDDNADQNYWISCMADTPGTYGFRLRQFRTQLIGCHSYMNSAWGSDNVATGVYFDKAAPDATLLSHFFEGQDATHRLAKDVDCGSGLTYPDYLVALGTRWANVVTQNLAQNLMGGGSTTRGYGSNGQRVFGASTGLVNWRETNGTHVANLNTSTAGSPSMQWPNKTKHLGYSGNYSTPTWSLDGATGSVQAGNPSGLGAKMSSGAGAPQITGALGDIWFRTDTPGTANQRIYVCTTAGTGTAAVWTPIA